MESEFNFLNKRFCGLHIFLVTRRHVVHSGLRHCLTCLVEGQASTRVSFNWQTNCLPFIEKSCIWVLQTGSSILWASEIKIKRFKKMNQGNRHKACPLPQESAVWDDFVEHRDLTILNTHLLSAYHHLSCTPGLSKSWGWPWSTWFTSFRDGGNCTSPGDALVIVRLSNQQRGRSA